MAYTAKESFATWINQVEPAITQAQLDSRIASIHKAIGSKQESAFWLDVVRIAYGINPKEEKNKTDLVEFFRKPDQTIPIINNDHLIKVLASISLCFILEGKYEGIEKVKNAEGVDQNKKKIFNVDADLNNSISLAISNANFLGQFAVTNGIPYKEYAEKWLMDSSANERPEIDVKIIEELNELDERIGEFEDEETIANDDYQLLIRAIKNNQHVNKTLQEEVDVLWWVFGGHSIPIGKSFKEIGLCGMSIVAPYELAEMTQNSSGFRASKQFLLKVLDQSRAENEVQKTIAPFSAINSLSDELKRKVIQDLENDISELTPCLLAIKKSLDYAANEDWSTGYKKITGDGDIKKSVPLIDFAVQLYRELIFAKYI